MSLRSEYDREWRREHQTPQEWMIHRYVKPRGSAEQAICYGRGVWVPVGTVVALNPWAACREARRAYPQAWRHAIKFRAMPMWE